jgi:hypothetical protein
MVGNFVDEQEASTSEPGSGVSDIVGWHDPTSNILSAVFIQLAEVVHSSAA